MEAWEQGLSDQPDPAVIDHRVAVDQDIAKPDYLLQVRNTPRKIGREFRELVQGFADDFELAFNRRTDKFVLRIKPAASRLATN